MRFSTLLISKYVQCIYNTILSTLLIYSLVIYLSISLYIEFRLLINIVNKWRERHAYRNTSYIILYCNCLIIMSAVYRSSDSISVVNKYIINLSHRKPRLSITLRWCIMVLPNLFIWLYFYNILLSTSIIF